jgi:cholesterol oxidase
MTLYLSRPFEDLEVQPQPPIQVHTLIVGSGYGAALSAIALAMRDDYKDGDHKIMVIERGNEFVPGDFPKTMSDLPAHVSLRRNNAARVGYADSLFDVRVGENVIAIVGSGLGGTSLINAGVAVDPDESTLAALPPPMDGDSAWPVRLAGSMRFVRHLLGVGPHPLGHALGKVVALRRIAERLAECCDQESRETAHHKLADIAVTFQDGENAVGVMQSKCNDCGNCFTGCNTGAKNTLAMNAWPLVRSLGVKLFTGGIVDLVQKSRLPGDAARDYPWIASAHRTTDVTAAHPIQIHAKCVILAAGTFGSTEILHRSSQRGLTVSSCLGTKFSLNGDGIGFGFGQRVAVNGAAKVPSARYIDPLATERPGPTIVSMIDLKLAGSRGLLEDATVPQAIARLCAEALSTQALMRGFAEDNQSAWHRDNAQSDPLAVSQSLIDHHQVVLGMHTDSATGILEYVEPQTGLDSAGLNLLWPGGERKQGDTEAASWIDEQLSIAESRQGFDGGLYLANPFLKPLPERFPKGVVGAAQFGGTYLCNHPLGGCPMGVDAADGVVNARGQVFCGGSGDAVHHGLYVLDGSIVPGALGINPYMTIASLAHHLAQRIDVPAAPDCPLPRMSSAPVSIPNKPGQVIDWPIPPLSFEFQERLFTSALKPDTEAVMALLGLPPNDHNQNSLVIDATITIADFYRWIEQPSQTLPARFYVYCYTRGDHTIDTVPDEDLGAPIGLCMNGSVQLFARDANGPSRLQRLWRSLLALRRFYSLRKNEIFEGLSGAISSGASPGLFEIISDFFRAACQSSHWRYLNYQFQTEINGRKLCVRGQKTLAYDGSKHRTVRDEANPWTTLTNLELHFSDSTAQERASAWFKVDLVRMAKDLKPLQIASGAETPQIMLAVSSLGALALRVLVQTHFFSFGAPSYDSFPTREFIEKHYALFEPPSKIFYVDAGSREEYRVKEIIQPPGEEWRLLHVSPNVSRQAASGNPLLLIHGMAHGSRVFYTDTVDRNLAGYLLHSGFEVWLLDHGISPGLRHAAGYKPTIDDISLQIAAAMRHIHDATKKKLIVFSHCVGSAALSMSILSGLTTLGGSQSDGSGSLIERLVMHAIPPWIYPSESNLLRAYGAVFFKDRFFPESIDPIPIPNAKNTKHPSGVDSLLDRIAFSLPWTKAEYDDHSFRDKDHEFGRAICNRMTAFYGYEWSHHNLDERTHKHIVSLVGPVDANAFRQLYFLLNRERVTTAIGENIYLRQDNIGEYWTFPTMFIHGRNNQVFNVESSVLAAHQLAALRSLQNAPSGDDRTVKLAVIDNYGHMDLLFGKNAYSDVFYWITDFFGQNVQPPSVDLPKSETQAPRVPMTGPVISNPRCSNGKHSVRVWMETNEFQTSETIAVRFDAPESSGARSETFSGTDRDCQIGSSTNLLNNSRYWLTDVECGERGVFVPRVINRDPGITFPTTLAEFTSELAPPGAPTRTKTSASLKGTENTAKTMDWRGLFWFQRFLSGDYHDSISFVVGSCWYPGSWFDHDISDRLFKTIGKEILKTDGIDSLLLVGDQIYADATYSIFDIAENRERFQESYRRGFNSPNAAWVLRHVPTYFAIDDHEFRDNYPTPFAGDAPSTVNSLGQDGSQEAWNFQMHHRVPPSPGDNRLWYSFESAGFQFFVFDTRSQRDPTQSGPQRLISTAQEAGFKNWVVALEQYPQGKPLFLVTGSPLVPVPDDELRYPARALSSDSLRAYPEFLKMVAQTLGNKHVGRPIVWLSGDPHYSSMGRFSIRDAQNKPLLNCVGIVSSGINVPLPFANARPDEVDWAGVNTEFKPSGHGINVFIHNVRKLCVSRQHAIRVDVKHSVEGAWNLQVTVVDAYDSACCARPELVTL